LHLGCWIGCDDDGRLKDEIWCGAVDDYYGDFCIGLFPLCIPPIELLLLLLVFMNGLALVCILLLGYYLMDGVLL
jgi:hypothetical protein